jgi:DNA-binding transcriptional regulator YiaG
MRCPGILARSAPGLPDCPQGAIPGVSVPGEKKQKPPLPMIVRQLRAWRHRNGLSQRAAAQVMQEHNCDILLATLQAWERGYRQPGRLAKKTLAAFLRAHPRIENPPVFKPGPK